MAKPIACPGSFMDSRAGIPVDSVNPRRGLSGTMPDGVLLELERGVNWRFVLLRLMPDEIRELARRLNAIADDMEVAG